MSCSICTHPQHAAINGDIDGGRSFKDTAKAYNVHHLSLYNHFRHGHSPLAMTISPGEVPYQITENPFSQFKQAWALTKNDPGMRQRMVSWLNDQLAQDEMEL